MSFWTDIRDTVEAPFNAAADFVSNIVGGKNVFDSAKQLGAQSIAAAVGPTALIYSTAPAQTVLKTLSPYTLGITGDAATVASQSKKINTGDTSSGSVDTELTTSGRLGLKLGAAYAGAELATGAGAYDSGLTTTDALLGASLSKTFTTQGAGAALGQGLSAFLPSDVSSFLGLDGSSGDRSGAYSLPKGTPRSGGSSGGASVTYQADQGSSVSPILLAAVGLGAAFLIFRGRRGHH